jgi:hypothetical protein
MFQIGVLEIFKECLTLLETTDNFRDPIRLDEIAFVIWSKKSIVSKPGKLLS